MPIRESVAASDAYLKQATPINQQLFVDALAYARPKPVFRGYEDWAGAVGDASGKARPRFPTRSPRPWPAVTRPWPRRRSNVRSLRPLGSERLWVLILLAPTLFGLVLGTFGAIFATLGLSVFDWDLLTPPEFVGAQNYIDLPDSRLFGKALWNTVMFSALYVPLVMILSFAVALVLNRGVRGQALFRVLYFLPVVSSPRRRFTCPPSWAGPSGPS